MRLRVFSDYGASEQVVTEDATPETVKNTMNSVNWQEFHQIVLDSPNGNMMEVGGSLNPDDGLSVLYQENGSQSVIKVPPTSVDEMTSLLLSYLSGTNDWKTGNQWE